MSATSIRMLYAEANDISPSDATAMLEAFTALIAAGATEATAARALSPAPLDPALVESPPAPAAESPPFPFRSAIRAATDRLDAERPGGKVGRRRGANA